MSMPDRDNESPLDRLEARIAREEDAASQVRAEGPEIVTFDGLAGAGVTPRCEAADHRRKRRGRR